MSGTRITLGIAILVAVIAMIRGQYTWIAVPATLFAMFLIVWGRESKRVEAFIARMPKGRYALKALEQLDLILSPRDREYDQQIRIIITDYNNDLRKSLRTIWKTRNANQIPSQQWEQFMSDGIVESPFNVRGGVRPELRDVVGRVLDELGA